MRIGDLLVEAGRVRAADVERALVRQRTTGARLGSTLVEAGVIDADEVARALARLHGVPAALARHLTGRDPRLTERVAAEVARGRWALPIARTMTPGGMALVVCFRDPGPDAIAAVGAAAGMPIVASVASEIVLGRELAMAYPAPRDADDEAVDIELEESKTFSEPSTPFSRLGEMSLVDLDDGRVSRDHSQSLMTGSVLDTGSFTRFTAPQPAVAPPATTIDEAQAAIAAATTRDAIAEQVLDYLRGGWRAAVVLVVREGMALGHRGFGGELTPAVIEAIGVRLDQPSFVRTAHDDRRPFVGEVPIGSSAQDRFMRLFAGVPAPRSVVAAPVIVRERVASLVVAVGPLAPLADGAAGVAAIVQAMRDAYARLIADTTA